MMQVGIHANMSDQATGRAADALHSLFRELGQRLTGQYGGVIEHLWIDLELIEAHAKPDGEPRYPFRLQKRVSGRSRFGLPPIADKFNVGHFSVRPDFHLLALLPVEEVPQYALSLIYDATAVLLGKQKKLGSFDAVLFRDKFLEACRGFGYEIPVKPV